MADGSIAAPSLTLNDVIMTSMLLLKTSSNHRSISAFEFS